MTDTVLIDVPMPIVTSRLLLRPPQEGDGAIVNEAKRASWDELAPWMIWAHGPRENLNVADDEAFCRRKHALFVRREDITLLNFERQTGRFLGGAGLHKCDWESRIFMVGFWIRSDAAGNGYATEAATALVHYAFRALAANRVWILHADGNEGSRRVIEKTGFTKEGVLRGHHGLLNGKLVDEHMYGILDDRDAPELDVRWGS